VGYVVAEHIPRGTDLGWCGASGEFLCGTVCGDATARVPRHHLL